MEEKARLLLKIHGHVQGVFYRQETQRKALELDLTGWVKNDSDNTVECLAEGEKNKLEQMINWCREGSDSAQVDKVDVKWLLYQGEFKEFVVSY